MHIIDLLDSMPEVVRLEYDNFPDFYDALIDVAAENGLYRAVPNLDSISENELKKFLSLLVPSKVKEDMDFDTLCRLFRAIDACFYTKLISY